MGYGKSLVNYTSQTRQEGQPSRVLRPRLVGYASLIVVLVGAFVFALGHRVPVELTVVRDRNRLYREIWDGSVENVYTLRISNRAADARDYRVVVESELPLAYEGPEVVEVAGGSLRAVPVRLKLDGTSAAAASTAPVRFGLRGTDGSEVSIDEASQFYLPARREP
jgi:polyferredoxin